MAWRDRLQFLFLSSATSVSFDEFGMFNARKKNNRVNHKGLVTVFEQSLLLVFDFLGMHKYVFKACFLSERQVNVLEEAHAVLLLSELATPSPVSKNYTKGKKE